MHREKLWLICILSHLFRPWGPVRIYNLLVVLTAFALGMTLSSGVQSATTLNQKSPLGMNLNGVSYYQSEMPFLNLFHTATQWTTHTNSTWDTGEEQYLNLDSDGYPITLTAKGEPSGQQFTSVGVLVARSLPSTPNGYYPGGQYVVLYDGQGTLTYGFDASLVSS